MTRAARGQRLGRQIQELVVARDPDLPVRSVRTLEEDQSGPRVAATIAGSVSIVGTLLAAMGIYGVTAFTVTRRTREIGIRVALGATSAEVVRMVLRQGVAVAIVGSIIGLGAAAAASRLLIRLLFGVPPLDPAPFAGAAALLGAIALAACYIPARRATRIDPLIAFRAD